MRIGLRSRARYISPIFKGREMRNYIHQKMDQVYIDFKTDCQKVECLCYLKELTYKSGTLPDYENPNLQRYYHLRYFPAYLAEYYYIYSNLLKCDFITEDLIVPSIGCGCGVDYWALYLALRDLDLQASKAISYTGVDAINWQYQDNLGNPNYSFIHKDITQWTKLDKEEYNVIIFAKSINEFSASGFSNLCSIFENSNFASDRLCLICSLMTKAGGMPGDSARSARLADILETHGFTTKDNKLMFTTLKDEYKRKGLNQVVSGFDYPDTLLNDSSCIEVLELCTTFQEEKVPCKDDCGTLNRKPILTGRYVNYKMLRYERRQKHSAQDG